jgi:hypothetical protein
MRTARSLLQLLLIVVIPSTVGAETTIYFTGYAVEVAPPIVLLVGGLALIAVGVGIRKFRRTRAPEPEVRSDVGDSPALRLHPVLIGPRQSDAEQAGRADPSQ